MLRESHKLKVNVLPSFYQADNSMKYSKYKIKFGTRSDKLEYFAKF